MTHAALLRRTAANNLPRAVITAVSGLALLLAALAAWSCAGGERERGASATTGITLNVIGEGYPPLLALEGVKDEFERQTGIRVNITKRDHMAVVAELDREFTAGEVSYDLVIVPHRLLGKFAARGNVMAIDTLLRDSTLYDRSAFDVERDLIPGWWREISWSGGRPYGFPFMALTMYTWYRKDLFANPREQAGFLARYGHPLRPPRTWNEYQQIAEFFNRPSEGLYGTGIQGQRHIALWYEWLSFATGFGARILDTSSGDGYGDIIVNSPEALRAAEFYMRMVSLSSPNDVAHNWDDALSSWQQGRTAIELMWHDSSPWVEDSSQSRVAGRVGYAVPPTVDGSAAVQLEGHTFLIPTLAPHPREAFRLMAWAMTRDVQIAQTLAGGLSPRLSTYDDRRVQAIPYMAVFREIVESARAVPKPTIPESPQISEAMTVELSRMVSREITPREALDNMAREVKRILGDKARLRYPPGRAR